jgi:hypothetical protein
MDETYSWHPGSGCVNPKWPVPVPLQPDELFSSWLIRAALAQGCDPLTLTGEVWPKWRAWTSDIDRGLNTSRLTPLSTYSGIPESAFASSMLRPVAEVTAGGILHAKAVWPWILALGARNRMHHGGLQYCPMCLANDRKPYFRLQWRFAWHVVCSRHRCALLDRCPHCHTPIEPHRLVAANESIAICANCKSDLRSTQIPPADAAALEFQESADEVIRRRTDTYGQEQLVPNEWFQLARYFITLSRKASMGQSYGLIDLLESLGIRREKLCLTATGLPFEFLPVGERTTLLGLTERMLSQGPDAFARATRDASLGMETIREPRQKLPSCIERIVSSLPEKRRARKSPPSKNPYIPRSPHAVMRMWARLQRKMRAQHERH